MDAISPPAARPRCISRRRNFAAARWLALGLVSAGRIVAGAAEPPTYEVMGITEAFFDATLSSPVAGIVGQHFFKEGDEVKAGQLIVELDKRMEELEVARRQTVLDNATEILRRTEELATRTRSIAREELDKQRAEQRIAQAELDLAKEQLRRRQIVAPFDGVVADLFNLDVGEGCQPQAPVIRLVDTRRCWFVSNIEANLAQSLRVGQRINLRLETQAGAHDTQAEIRFISPVADPASGLVKIKALFENGEIRIPAGITAAMRLTRPQHASAPPAAR